MQPPNVEALHEEGPSSPVNWLELSPELWQGQVFNKLPPRVLAILSCTCKGMRSEVRRAEAWRTAVMRYSGPESCPAEAVRNCKMPSYELYRELHTLQSARWLPVRLQPGPRPCPREHFSLNYLANGWLVLFGGLNHTGSQYFNDLWLLDVKSDPSGPRWHQLQTGAERPHPRAYHFAATLHGRILVIHGGLFPQGYRMNDTWRIDLGRPNPQWEQIGHFVLDDNFGMVPGRPIPRFHHTAALVGRNLVIFGGHNYRRDEIGDTWVLDVMSSPLQPWLPVLGTSPQRRAYQASTVIEVRGSRGSLRPMLFIHGGSTVGGQLLNDCWVLDLEGSDPGWRLVHQQRKPLNSGPDMLGSSGGTSNGNNKPGHNGSNNATQGKEGVAHGGNGNGSGGNGGKSNGGQAGKDGAFNETIALIEDDMEEDSISDIITKTDSAAPARLEGTLGSPGSNVHPASGRSSRSVLGAVRREEPPCPRERHMCAPVLALGTEESSRTPSVVLVGGMGGMTDGRRWGAGDPTYGGFKELFLGQAGSHVLTPDPHVLVLNGLTRTSEVSGDTGSGSSGQSGGSTSGGRFKSSKQASSSQHGQHRTILKEASGGQEQSAAISRSVIRSRPKGFWLRVPRLMPSPGHNFNRPLPPGATFVPLGPLGVPTVPVGAQQHLLPAVPGNALALATNPKAGIYGAPGNPGNLGIGTPLSLGTPSPDHLPRREGMCLRLRTGHLLLFGGNDGRLTDVFGDGDHQYGLNESMLIDLEALQEMCRFPRLFAEETSGPSGSGGGVNGSGGGSGGDGHRAGSGDGSGGNGSLGEKNGGQCSEAANMSSAAHLATAVACQASPIAGLVLSDNVLPGRSDGGVNLLRSSARGSGQGSGGGGSGGGQGSGQGSGGGGNGSSGGSKGQGGSGQEGSGQGSGHGSAPDALPVIQINTSVPVLIPLVPVGSSLGGAAAQPAPHDARPAGAAASQPPLAGDGSGGGGSSGGDGTGTTPGGPVNQQYCAARAVPEGAGHGAGGKAARKTDGIRAPSPVAFTGALGPQLEFPQRRNSPHRKETPSPLMRGFLSAPAAKGKGNGSGGSPDQGAAGHGRESPSFAVALGTGDVSGNRDQPANTLDGTPRIRWTRIPLGAATASQDNRSDEFPVPPLPQGRGGGTGSGSGQGPLQAGPEKAAPHAGPSGHGNGTVNGSGSGSAQGQSREVHRLGRIVSSKGSSAPLVLASGGQVQGPTGDNTGGGSGGGSDEKGNAPSGAGQGGGNSSGATRPGSSQEAVITAVRYRPRDVPIPPAVIERPPLTARGSNPSGSGRGGEEGGGAAAAAAGGRSGSGRSNVPRLGLGGAVPPPPSVLGSAVVSMEEHCEALLVTPNWNERNPSLDVYILKILPDFNSWAMGGGSSGGRPNTTYGSHR